MGLLEMGLRPGDTLSTWITCTEAAESYMVHLACYRAGISIFPIASEEDYVKALSSSSALLFSPWEDHEGTPRVDLVLKQVPSLLNTPAGSLVKSKHATKYFIQTGFSTIRGTFKLKSIPVYSPLQNPVDKFNYHYKGTDINNDQFENYAAIFAEKVGAEETVLNTVSCKEVFGFGSIAAALKYRIKTVSCVMDDIQEAAMRQNARVIVIAENKLRKIGSDYEVDKIVLGVNSLEDVKKARTVLEQQGVKAKEIFPFSLKNLASVV